MDNQPTVTQRFEKSLFELADIYRKHRQYIKVKHKVTALEMEIIQLVTLEGKKKMKDIGNHFRVKLSTLTSVIDKIEKQKLVKRINSKEDRRVVYLDVTKKGERLYNDYSRYRKATAKMMNEQLNKSEFQAFQKGLDVFFQVPLTDN